MPSQRNINQLKEISEKLKDTSAVVLVNYSGISVADQQQLRKTLVENNSLFNVSKNSLLSLALNKRSPELVKQLSNVLQGPTAVIYTQDVAAIAKILDNFNQDHPNFTVKAGLSLKQNRVIPLEEIELLAKLPSKDQLYATLLSQLNAPAQSLVRVLTAPIQNLVYVLQNHAERG